MTKQERWGLYENGEIRQLIAVDLLDWVGYWTTAGVDAIDDELLRRQTKQGIHLILEDLPYCIKIVTALVVADPTFANASSEAINETLISGIVTNIMSFKLYWLTGVSSVE